MHHSETEIVVKSAKAGRAAGLPEKGRHLPRVAIPIQAVAGPVGFDQPVIVDEHAMRRMDELRFFG